MDIIKSFEGVKYMVMNSNYFEVVRLDKEHPYWGEFSELLKDGLGMSKRQINKYKNFVWVIIDLYKEDFKDLASYSIGDLNDGEEEVLDINFVDNETIILTEYALLDEEKPNPDKLDKYKVELKQAVESENYEKAAILRDRIKKLKEKTS